MSVNFFEEAHKSSTSGTLFGLCDDNSTPKAHAEPAYLSEDLAVRETEWIAEVSNDPGFAVDFHPVDNCVCIESGKCDGLVHYDHRLIFVELKERSGRKNNREWKKVAREQLTNTIEHFRKNHDVAGYASIKAFICNRSRPQTTVVDANVQQQFKSDTGAILYMGKNIVL